jgi:hypothetical protein
LDGRWIAMVVDSNNGLSIHFHGNSSTIAPKRRWRPTFQAKPQAAVPLLSRDAWWGERRGWRWKLWGNYGEMGFLANMFPCLVIYIIYPMGMLELNPNMGNIVPFPHSSNI